MLDSAQYPTMNDGDIDWSPDWIEDEGWYAGQQLSMIKDEEPP